jgi:hypothetical protein
MPGSPDCARYHALPALCNYFSQAFGSCGAAVVAALLRALARDGVTRLRARRSPSGGLT